MNVYKHKVMLFWVNDSGVENGSVYLFIYLFLKILFIYSRQTQKERGRDIGRGRSRLPKGSPMWDSIPGLWGHSLS